MAVTVLTHSCLKFSDISLFTMHVVARCRHYTICHSTQDTSVHATRTWSSWIENAEIRLYIYVATCVVNKDILNFSQEYVNIVIALVFTLYL